jgi:hypothetical protein
LHVKRKVEAELLDELPPEDPRARGSRADLRRLNALMANARLAARALVAEFGDQPPQRIVELGAGDGNFLLSVARLLAPLWPRMNVGLVDRQKVARPETMNGFSTLGWQAEVVVTDVFEWLGQSSSQSCDALIANLFLHHFSPGQLSKLFEHSAGITRFFVAVEPRRSAWAFACSRLVGLVGCNAVTRHDAPISVRAGFAGSELSRLWPRDEPWLLEERSAGLFSHLFVARKGNGHQKGRGQDSLHCNSPDCSQAASNLRRHRSAAFRLQN